MGAMYTEPVKVATVSVRDDVSRSPVGGERAQAARDGTSFELCPLAMRALKSATDITCPVEAANITKRAATLMLKRYGDKTLEESIARADEFAAQDDRNGVAVWRRITDTVPQAR